MKEDIKDLKTEKGPEWFENLFGHWGIKGWVASILNSSLWIVIIVVIVLVIVSCLLKTFNKFVAQAFLINKEGGSLWEPLGLPHGKARFPGGRAKCETTGLLAECLLGAHCRNPRSTCYYVNSRSPIG